MSEAPFDREMTLLEHLAELRQRLIIIGLAIVVGMAIAAVFLTWPVMAILAEPVGKLQALRPTETFVTFMKVALVVGAAIAMPIVIWQSLLFVLPALHPHERKHLYFAIPSASIAFLLGLFFGLRVVVPAAVNFLQGFGGDVVENNWTIEEYLSFISTFLFWIGVSFETPIILFYLVKLGVVTRQQLSGVRRYALLASFVIAAMVTPTPDPLNQAIVAIPIYLLYELGLLFSRFA